MYDFKTNFYEYKYMHLKNPKSELTTGLGEWQLKIHFHVSAFQLTSLLKLHKKSRDLMISEFVNTNKKKNDNFNNLFYMVFVVKESSWKHLKQFW